MSEVAQPHAMYQNQSSENAPKMVVNYQVQSGFTTTVPDDGTYHDLSELRSPPSDPKADVRIEVQNVSGDFLVASQARFSDNVVFEWREDEPENMTVTKEGEDNFTFILTDMPASEVAQPHAMYQNQSSENAPKMVVNYQVQSGFTTTVPDDGTYHDLSELRSPPSDPKADVRIEVQNVSGDFLVASQARFSDNVVFEWREDEPENMTVTKEGEDNFTFILTNMPAS